MQTFVVTYEHPDDDGWRLHLMPHIAWLRERVADGSLLASGPLDSQGVKAALLLVAAADRAGLDAIIAGDPFAEQGLIANMTVRVWDPIFGVFNQRSSMPAG